VEKHGTAGQATDDKTRHMLFVCWMAKITGARAHTHARTHAHAHTHTHTLRIRNTYCFPTATMVTRTRLNISLYIYYLSCFRCMCSFRSTTEFEMTFQFTPHSSKRAVVNLICSCLTRNLLFLMLFGVRWSSSRNSYTRKSKGCS
jgi:hypothetical protein